MKPGRPGSMPHRACCTAGDMMVEETIRKIEMKFARNGIINRERIADAAAAIQTAIAEIEATVNSASPRAASTLAMLENACLDRLRRAHDLAREPRRSNFNIAMEELRFAARPPALAEFPKNTSGESAGGSD